MGGDGGEGGGWGGMGGRESLASKTMSAHVRARPSLGGVWGVGEGKKGYLDSRATLSAVITTALAK
jgi:hypothetical protein